jgi:hypothetical protein
VQIDQFQRFGTSPKITNYRVVVGVSGSLKQDAVHGGVVPHHPVARFEKKRAGSLGELSGRSKTRIADAGMV